MNDAQNVTTEQTSMADIAATVKADAPVTESGNQSHQPQTVKEPENVSEFTDFVAKQSQTTKQLQEQLEKTSSTLDELVNGKHQEQVNKEIKNAVSTLNENAGANEKMAELYLRKQYDDDPNFARIWDNRGKNPDALKQAVSLLSKEWESMTQNVVDPQVAENQRALMDSQRSGGTVQETSLDDKLANMGDAEFMKYMRRLGR
jgi:DNA-binding protein H-NS